MQFSFLFTRPQLKVISAICSNLVVVWLAALFVTHEPFALTLNFFAATLSWNLAVQAERALEYD